jgi:hypothetical protein
MHYWMQEKTRPLGVTIIAILIVISGVLILIVGIGLIFVVIGAIPLAIGLAYLVMAYGLLNGRGWAWTISTIVLIIGIILQIVSIPRTIASGSSLSGDIISIAISVFILYYLYRPHVKSYFGRTVF